MNKLTFSLVFLACLSSWAQSAAQVCSGPEVHERCFKIKRTGEAWLVTQEFRGTTVQRTQIPTTKSDSLSKAIAEFRAWAQANDANAKRKIKIPCVNEVRFGESLPRESVCLELLPRDGRTRWRELVAKLEAAAVDSKSSSPSKAKKTK